MVDDRCRVGDRFLRLRAKILRGPLDVVYDGQRPHHLGGALKCTAFFMQVLSPQKLAIGSEASAFLVLAWQEMFDPYVPDTFQPPLFNLPLLIAELESIAAKAQGSEKWLHHVSAIREELAVAVERDEALLTGTPYLHWAADLLSKEVSAKKCAEIARTLAVHENAYQQLIRKQLRAAAEKLPLQKEAAFRLLRRLATIAVNAGFRADDFQDLCQSSNFEIPVTEWVDQLIARTDLTGPQNERLYHCTFAIDAEPRLLRRVARKLGFQLQRSENVHEELRLRVPEAASFIFIELKAKTAFEALQSATRQVRPALDIFNFYSRNYSMTLFTDAMVSAPGSGPALLKVGGQSLRKLPARPSAPKLASHAIKEIIPRLLTGQIFNALEHYTLSQTSSAYRVKLVNLWAALECLASSAPDSTVMDRVKALVLPIILWRRIDKITRYIATSLTSWRQLCPLPLGPGFLDKGIVSAEEVLLALTKPEHHIDITSLLEATAAHPLLCNRIFMLWKRFSNPSFLLKDIEISRERTGWHLLRIYRARNLIVHYGEEVQCVPHLLDHLQYYFSLTLSRILDSLSSHQDWAVSEAIAHWTLREAYITHQLKHDAQALRIRDFFPRPIRHIHEQIWA